MLKVVTTVLRSGLVAAAVALLPLIEAAAQGYIPPPLLRSCFIPLGSSASVTITAGTTATAEFPVTVTSTADPLCPSSAGTCLKWDYTWDYVGTKSSQSVLGIDADVTLLSASDTYQLFGALFGGDSSTGYGFANFGEVGVRFTSSLQTYKAAVYTPVGVGIGRVSAGGKAGRDTGFCQIAGAGMVVGDPNLAQPLSVEETIFGCKVRWGKSADGCVTSVQVVPGQGGSCNLLQTGSSNPTNPDGQPTKSASCSTAINESGSAPCLYKQWSSTLKTYLWVQGTTVPPCSP